MPKIRDLKKMINYELSDVIESCYEWQLIQVDKANLAESIIDEAIISFDKLIERVNLDNVTQVKAHFKSIQVELFKKKEELLSKLQKL